MALSPVTTTRLEKAAVEVVSDALDGVAREVMGLGGPLRVQGLADRHRGYLPWHRAEVYGWRDPPLPQGRTNSRNED